MHTSPNWDHHSLEACLLEFCLPALLANPSVTPSDFPLIFQLFNFKVYIIYQWEVKIFKNRKQRQTTEKFQYTQRKFSEGYQIIIHFTNRWKLYTYSRYILRWKFVCCVGYQKTCFANSTVIHSNTVNCLHFWKACVSALNISHLMMTSAPLPTKTALWWDIRTRYERNVGIYQSRNWKQL